LNPGQISNNIDENGVTPQYPLYFNKNPIAVSELGDSLILDNFCMSLDANALANIQKKYGLRVNLYEIDSLPYTQQLTCDRNQLYDPISNSINVYVSTSLTGSIGYGIGLNIPVQIITSDTDQTTTSTWLNGLTFYIEGLAPYTGVLPIIAPTYTNNMTQDPVTLNYQVINPTIPIQIGANCPLDNNIVSYLQSINPNNISNEIISDSPVMIRVYHSPDLTNPIATYLQHCSYIVNKNQPYNNISFQADPNLFDYSIANNESSQFILKADMSLPFSGVEQTIMTMNVTGIGK